MSETVFDPFPAADLPANQAGRITDDQRKRWSNYERGSRKGRIGLAAVFAVIAALLLTATGPAPNAAYRPLAGGIFALLAVVTFFYGAIYTDSLTHDLGAGRVETVEGAIGKHTYSTNSRGSTSTSYYLDVANRHFEVGRASYETAPGAGWVRLYVLPRSHKVVNLERLPDRIPEGAAAAAMGNPMAAMAQLGNLLRAHDSESRNEAMAESAALEHQMQTMLAAAATPPASQLDSRPLTEAILGTWSMGMMSMTFMPDGTMVATMPGGRQENGKWSVGPDGKLHSNATGRDQAAAAWIAGDTLTISDEGRGLAFHRVAAS